MKALKAKIQPIGGSGALAIPLTLAKVFEWAPGAVVRAKLTIGGAYFEKEVRELYGGRSSGIIIPKDVLVAHDLAVGDEVEVPFHEWVTVKSASWPDEKPKRTREKKSAKKVSRSAARPA